MSKESENLKKIYLDSNHVNQYLGKNKVKIEEEDFKPSVRVNFSDLYRSEQQSLNFLRGKFDTVIDIGCGTGSLSQALLNHSNDKNKYKYLGIDIDQRMIDSANKYFKNHNINFICKDIFAGSNLESLNGFELLLGFNLLTQYSDWKNTLRALKNLNSKYINFSSLLTFNSPTIVDKDLSYTNYNATTNKVTQVVTAIHNIFWLYSFLCSPGMDASEVNVFCYKKNTLDMIHPIDLNDLYVGNIVAEFDINKSWIKTGKRPRLRIYDNEFLRYSNP